MRVLHSDLRQPRETKLKLKETNSSEQSLADELLREVVQIFQLRSQEAALLSLSLTDINNGDEFVRETHQNLSHCFHQGRGQLDEECQFIQLFGISININPDH